MCARVRGVRGSKRAVKGIRKVPRVKCPFSCCISELKIGWNHPNFRAVTWNMNEASWFFQGHGTLLILSHSNTLTHTQIQHTVENRHGPQEKRSEPLTMTSPSIISTVKFTMKLKLIYSPCLLILHIITNTK